MKIKSENFIKKITNRSSLGNSFKYTDAENGIVIHMEKFKADKSHMVVVKIDGESVLGEMFETTDRDEIFANLEKREF